MSHACHVTTCVRRAEVDGWMDRWMEGGREGGKEGEREGLEVMELKSTANGIRFVLVLRRRGAPRPPPRRRTRVEGAEDGWMSGDGC